MKSRPVLFSATQFQALESRLRRWAPDILAAQDDNEELGGTRIALAQSIAWLRDCGNALSYQYPLSAHQQAWRDIQAVLMLPFLRSEHTLRDAVSHSLDVVLPDLLEIPDLGSSHWLNSQTETACGSVPSWSTRRRNFFALDLAYALVDMERQLRQPRVRFGWQDATLQKTDWMMSKYKWVANEDLVDVVDAQDQLLKHRSALRRGDDSDSEVDEPFIDRVKHNKFISAHVHEHLLTPASIALGHHQAADIAAITLHQHGIVSQSMSHLRSQLDEFISNTTDLGTEVKNADFHVHADNLHRLMPDWMLCRPNALVPDDGHECVRQTHADATENCRSHPAASASRILNAPGQQLLRNCFTITGAHHSIHTISRDMFDTLPDSEKFWANLEVLEAILCDEGRKERFIATCLLGSEYESSIPEFRKFSIQLYKKRWRVVVTFCRASIQHVAIMRRVWDEAKYAAGVIGESDGRQKKSAEREFKPADLSAVLNCSWHKLYTRCVIKLETIPLRVDKWFDGCACHEHLLVGLRKDRRKTLKSKEGLRDGTCPFASCRAWELDRIDQVLQEIQEAVLGELNNFASTEAFDEAVVARVLPVFHRGVAYLELGFQVKFSYRNVLPWELFKLAHPNIPKARSVATRLTQWAASLSREQWAGQHRLTRKFLEPGSMLSAQIASFGNDGVLLPQFALERATFRFIPFSDTLIECEHVYLQDIVKQKKGTKHGARFSAAHRFVHLRAEMRLNSSFKQALISKFIEVSSTRKAIKALGLEYHPTFVEYVKTKKRTLRRDPVAQSTDLARAYLQAVVYRQSIG